MQYLSNALALAQISTLSLHDALPIYGEKVLGVADVRAQIRGHRVERLQEPGECARVGSHDRVRRVGEVESRDRKSTRLNSSHTVISYAVFCLKKKKSHRKRQDDPVDY